MRFSLNCAFCSLSHLGLSVIVRIVGLSGLLNSLEKLFAGAANTELMVIEATIAPVQIRDSTFLFIFLNSFSYINFI
jgi:hypothetical protein